MLLKLQLTVKMTARSEVSFNLINATSLVKPAALQQLATELTQLNARIAGITKTWFNSRQLDQFPNVDGYFVFHKDHLEEKCRGVAIYINNILRLKLSCLNGAESAYTEVLWVKCNYNEIHPSLHTHMLI